MLFLRSFTVKFLYFLTQTTFKILLCLAGLSLTAMGLSLIEGIGKFHLLATIIETDAAIRGPFMNVVGTLIPTGIGGWNASFLVWLAGIFIMIALILFYQDRLLNFTEDIIQERRWRAQRAAHEAEKKAEP
ncbi:hypothetical protein ACFL2T_07540 [Elusimicrobiota bacterium]